MKRILTKICVFCIIVSIVASVFSVYTFADDDLNVAEMSLDTPAAFYFSALNTNYGNNIRNSCGYVAAAMLLSYYDHYWHGGIIDDKYNNTVDEEYISINSDTMTLRRSPGIETDYWTPALEHVFGNYDSFIENWGPTHYLHPELMRIGKDVLEFEHTKLDAETISGGSFTDFTNSNDPRWYTFPYEVYELLNYYFHDYSTLRGNDGTTSYVTVHFDTYSNYEAEADPDEAIREQIIQKIKNGIPVIYMATTSDNAGHAMIAYDYDIVTDTIMFHYGYSVNTANPKFAVNESVSEYKYNISCIWISIDESKLPHQCSKFYYDSFDNKTHCMCEFNIHPEHVHTTDNPVYQYSSNDNDARKGHWIANCYGCKALVEHTYSYFIDFVNPNKHNCICVCGYETTGSHIVKSSGGTIQRCVDCGAIVNLNNGPGMLQSIVVTQITDNGSYVRSDGIIVLTEYDMSLYLSGELDVDILLYDCETK